jgi:hypothetical protein
VQIINFTQIDPKTWTSGFLRFKDMGRIKDGVTHRYEVLGMTDESILGWVEWKSGWRRYTFRPATGYETWFDALCLTILAEFVKMRTDERKAHWGPQGRFADR